jgi:phosphoribosylformylglycinamidine synthase
VLLDIGAEPRSLAGSRWAWTRGHHDGPAPALDLDQHERVVALVRQLVVDGLLMGVHDASDGIGLALAEMAVRSGLGFRVAAVEADHAWLFAESASRVVACVHPDRAPEVVRAARSAEVRATAIGSAGGDAMVIDDLVDVRVADAVAAWRGRLPDALGAGTSH